MKPTGHFDKDGNEIFDGDTLFQDCKMIDDYTGKSSIERQRLIVQFDTKNNRWGVYCPDAMLKDNWGFIPEYAYKDLNTINQNEQ